MGPRAMSVGLGGWDQKALHWPRRKWLVDLYSLLLNIPSPKFWRIKGQNRDPPSKCFAGYTLVNTICLYTMASHQNFDSRWVFSIKRRFPAAASRLLRLILASWRPSKFWFSLGFCAIKCRSPAASSRLQCLILASWRPSKF